MMLCKIYEALRKIDDAVSEETWVERDEGLHSRSMNSIWNSATDFCNRIPYAMHGPSMARK